MAERIEEDDYNYVSKEELSRALSVCLQRHFPEIKHLNKEQFACLHNFINGRDVFAILPTGYGKSLIFQIAPVVISYLAHHEDYDEVNIKKKPIIIVVSPLVSLIQAHLSELRAHNIKAACLGSADEDGILNGEFPLVYGNAESWIQDKKWREMLQSKHYQDNVVGIVTDEVHVVPKWGEENKKEKQQAFRISFSRLSELRTLSPVGIPIMALTATANKDTQSKVKKYLNLQRCIMIKISPNRENIYLYKKKVTPDLKTTFGWLADIVKEKGKDTERTFIYCKSLKDCGKVFSFFKYELGDQIYDPSTKKCSGNLLVAMYHHSTLPKQQRNVLDSLLNPDGVCRIVIATNALGMGINITNVRQVIHYGPPHGIENFVQEIGRAGRDRKPARSLLLFLGNHLKRCDKSLKQYSNEKTKCLRTMLLQEFDETVSETRVFHDCCVNCHLNCKCTGSDCSKEHFQLSTDTHTVELPKRSRNVTGHEKQLLRDMLKEYQGTLTANFRSLCLDSSAVTGFSEQLINAIVNDANHIFDVNYIIDNFPVFKMQHAKEILLIFSEVFEDILIENDPNTEAYYKTVYPDYDLTYGGEFEQDTSDSENELSETSSLSSLFV